MNIIYISFTFHIITPYYNYDSKHLQWTVKELRRAAASILWNQRSSGFISHSSSSRSPAFEVHGRGIGMFSCFWSLKNFNSL